MKFEADRALLSPRCERMTVHVALMLFCLVPTDPLAAFEANFARCRVSVAYRYESWTASPGVVHRLRRGQPIEMESTRNVWAVGTWAFDGTTQHFDFGEPGAGYELRYLSLKGGSRSFASRRRESLFDGETTAELAFEMPNNVIQAQDNRPGQFGCWGYSPFNQSGSTNRLTFKLMQDFPDAIPITRRDYRDGRIFDVAIYDRKANGRTRNRFEVEYDAEAGFLPRYSRSISTTTEETSVSETFLIRTQAVPGGGFVPMEWYETGFSLHEAPRQANEYDVGTEVRPSGPVWLNHFVASDVRPQSEPVSLKHLVDVKALSLPGGRVPFDPNSAPVTMARVKEAAGAKLAWPDLDRSASLDPTFVDRPYGGVPEAFPSWEAYLGQPAEDSWALGAIIATSVASLVTIAAFYARRKLKLQKDAPPSGQASLLDPVVPPAAESRAD